MLYTYCMTVYSVYIYETSYKSFFFGVDPECHTEHFLGYWMLLKTVKTRQVISIKTHILNRNIIISTIIA